MAGVDDDRLTIGGRRGRGRRAGWALAAVAALGLGAGGGAVLGLWGALSWAVAGPPGSRSPGGVLLAGGVGALTGALLGTVVAGVAVAAVTAVRRRGR